MDISHIATPLNSLVLLVSVLVAFVKIFGEAHEKSLNQHKNRARNYDDSIDNDPTWRVSHRDYVDTLRVDYENIESTSPINLNVIIFLSFAGLVALSIGFVGIFSDNTEWFKFLNEIFLGNAPTRISWLSIYILALYLYAVYLYMRMIQQKMKLARGVSQYIYNYDALKKASTKKKTETP